MTSRKNRKNLSKKTGGWKYKSPKNTSTSKIGSPMRKPNYKIRGGKCGCAVSKFFSGGSANLDGAQNVIPLANYSNDPQRMVSIGNLPQTGGRRRTLRKNRKISKTLGRKRRGGAALSFPNVISSFATSPDMNNVTNSVFKTQSMTNPLVYSQDSLKMSTMV